MSLLSNDLKFAFQPVKGYEKKMKEQKRKQEKLITQLREQLQEMEEAVVKVLSLSVFRFLPHHCL